MTTRLPRPRHPISILCLLAGCVASSVPRADPIARDDAVDAWISQICEQQVACGCRASDVSCAGEQMVLESAFDAAEDAGLHYDGQCVGDAVAALARQGCTSPGDDSAPTCEERCAPFFGDTVAGEPCEWVAGAWVGTRLIRASDCARGLTCAEGLCQPACGELGSACSISDECRTGESCLGGFCQLPPPTDAPCPNGVCDGDAYCSVAEGICRAAPTTGEACSLSLPCASEALCDGTVCQAKSADGESCAAQETCVSGYCPDGSCRPEPQVDEPCPLGRCADGGLCDGGTCRASIAVCEM